MKLLQILNEGEPVAGRSVSSMKFAKGHPNQKFYDAFKQIAGLAKEAQHTQDFDYVKEIEEIAKSFEGRIGVK